MFKSQNFAQFVENVVQTCVCVPVCLLLLITVFSHPSFKLPPISFLCQDLSPPSPHPAISVLDLLLDCLPYPSKEQEEVFSPSLALTADATEVTYSSSYHSSSFCSSTSFSCLQVCLSLLSSSTAKHLPFPSSCHSKEDKESEKEECSYRRKINNKRSKRQNVVMKQFPSYRSYFS